MCLILFALNVHEKYPFILVSNRDEYYNRPTQRPHFWEEYHDLLAGKDKQKGGTWMGITKTGKFAAITNYRDGKDKRKFTTSRGNIVGDYLLEKDSINNYANTLTETSSLYAGYNLLFGSFEESYYFSNKLNETQKVQDGIHGLSNAFLNTDWFKVTRGKLKFADIISRNEHPDVDELFKMMQDKTKAPDNLLPNTGVSNYLEKELSPLFIKIPVYGTRSTTILLYDIDGNITLYEQSYGTFGKTGDPLKFKFSIKK